MMNRMSNYLTPECWVIVIRCKHGVLLDASTEDLTIVNDDWDD